MQSKIIREKKQENTTHVEEKIQSIKTNRLWLVSEWKKGKSYEIFNLPKKK